MYVIHCFAIKDYIIEIYAAIIGGKKTSALYLYIKTGGKNYGFWHNQITIGNKQLNFVQDISFKHSKRLKPCILIIRFVRHDLF